METNVFQVSTNEMESIPIRNAIAITTSSVWHRIKCEKPNAQEIRNLAVIQDDVDPPIMLQYRAERLFQAVRERTVSLDLDLIGDRILPIVSRVFLVFGYSVLVIAAMLMVLLAHP